MEVNDENCNNECISGNGALSTNADHSNGRLQSLSATCCTMKLKNELHVSENELDVKERPRPQAVSRRKAVGSTVDQLAHEKENIVSANSIADSKLSKDSAHLAKTGDFGSIYQMNGNKRQNNDRSLEHVLTCRNNDAIRNCNAPSGSIQAPACPEKNLESYLCAPLTETDTSKQRGRRSDNASSESFTSVSEALMTESENQSKSNVCQPTLTAERGISQRPELCDRVWSGDYDDALAVAIEVTGEEEESIPSAIKYDPESTIPESRNHRSQLYCIVITLVMAAVCTSVTFGVLMGIDSNETKPPSVSATTNRSGEGIFYQLVEIVGEANLQDPNSSYVRAADWIINADPMELQALDDNLAQRYLLVLFYLTTAMDKQWRSCNPPSAYDDDHCSFDNIASQDRINQPKIGTIVRRWLSAGHECDWAGITCDEINQVRIIDLAGQEIRGTFPADIFLLPFLQSLALPINEFYGTLPKAPSSAKHLLNVELQYNLFTGHIPTEWYNVISLQSFNVGTNLITGSISTEIGKLTNLKGLFVQENTLEGTIPTEFGNLKSIAYSRWSRNILTGTLPSELGNLRRLKELWLAKNKLTGRMPSELGDMNSILDLRLNHNQITGSIPDEHFNLTQLRIWELQDMKLSGSLSDKIGRMSNLQIFLISANHLSGTIPSEMGRMNGLEEVGLQLNELGGTVPHALCSRRGPRGIVILGADCGPLIGGGDPTVLCSRSCCTTCCESTTGFCILNGNQTR